MSTQIPSPPSPTVPPPARENSSKADNIVAINKGLYPLVNFNFLLRVELVYDLPCKSVKAFTREMEYELIQEGGLNDYVHMRRKPISKPFTLEIERYAGTDFLDPLPLGADLALPVFLFVSRYQDNFIGTARTYVFTGCTVTKKVFGELQADRSGLLTDTITLAYREMICVNTAWSDLSANLGTGEPTNTLWSSKWSTLISDKNTARVKAESDRKSSYETFNLKLDVLKGKEAELQAAYVAKQKLIASEREDKLKDLEALNEKIIEQVAKYEEARRDLLKEREALVTELKDLQSKLLETTSEKEKTRLSDIAKERDAKDAELKALYEKEESEKAAYEAMLSQKMAEREEKVTELKALREEKNAEIEAHEAMLSKLEDERKEKVAELKALREKEKAEKEEYEAILSRLMDERKEKDAELKALRKEEEAAAASYEEERAAILKEREELVKKMQSNEEE